MTCSSPPAQRAPLEVVPIRDGTGTAPTAGGGPSNDDSDEGDAGAGKSRPPKTAPKAPPKKPPPKKGR